ncbi:OmpA family protein [Tunicatimonas pelagia]|uniref:OmpA family protein n=1 Tax=Tunicatimonas pelagia TaxID=931531 RepID=UPI0026658AB0|nr:OmpA family protein [Tunicatimonas pelagia]WKN41411.1 OmpA family protein [Tunicatimonas pelagia]
MIVGIDRKPLNMLYTLIRLKGWSLVPRCGILAIALLTWLTTLSVAQGSDGALVDRANKFFLLAKNYEAALPLYQQAVDNGVSEPLVHYRLGVCYAEANELQSQLKALSYLNYAQKQQATAGIPNELNYYLGKTYHRDIQIQEAIKAYERYKKELKADDKQKLDDVNRQLEICTNALFLIGEKKSMVINSFETINSEYTEYNPLITADEGMLAYTAVREKKGKITEQIFTARKSNGQWSTPQPLSIKANAPLGTAGISPDGQEMLVFIGGDNNSGSIYRIEQTSKGWSNPVTLGKNINSRYLESTASITPNRKTIYFASNRKGGYGGMDIYKAERQPDGEWGKPENLGPTVNTEYNEDAPFIHPDSRTLFFTSDGHGTMGGNDIFKTHFLAGEWQEPENMGYPINTPTDDNYFTLTANGKMGYFSSERKGGKGGQDIYYFEMPEHEANIPLTLIKGRILAGETDPKPIPTEIKVVDVEAKQQLDYVYSPSAGSGNYLIILPPGRNYDLIIESEGYLPYTVNVNIPNQNNFYELYQEIILKPIKQFDVVVGQEISVKNAFFDTKNTKEKSVRVANEAMLVQNDSLDLFDMMEAIIASNDGEAYDYLLGLMYKTNPIEDVDFDALDSEKLEAAGVSYYYDETGEDNLIAKKVGNETVYTLPTFFVTEEAIKQKGQKVAASGYDPSLLKETYKIYFSIGESQIEESYSEILAKVLEPLKKYQDLGIEITGYASPDGDAETNKKLSNERAIEVLNFFNQRGVVRRRILARGQGATEAVKVSAEESRRVEIRLVDLND